MSSLVNIAEHAGLLFLGAVLFYLLLRWRDRNPSKSQVAEAQSIVDKAREEAEIILRDARLGASEESLKLKEQTEQVLDTRRTERLELERRLSEREALVNSQLERIVEAERTLNHEKEILRKKTEAVEAQQSELAELSRREREGLQKLAGLSDAEAREAFLKRIEQEALRDANTLSRHIVDKL